MIGLLYNVQYIGIEKIRISRWNGYYWVQGSNKHGDCAD